METAATDFDILVSRGFDPEKIRMALASSCGDMRKATLILSNQLDPSEAVGWTSTSDTDWANHKDMYIPTRTENRALWKSPIYVRVASFRHADDETVLFVLNIVLKDGQHFEKLRRLSSFVSFYKSLPDRLVNNFVNKFPKRNLIPWKSSVEKIELKRMLLEEWMRELCMNEACMRDRTVLVALCNFLEIEGKRLSVNKADDPAEARVVTLSNYKEDWVAVPEKSLSRLPVSINSLAAGMPFKVRTSTIFSTEEDKTMLNDLLTGSVDASDLQLSKDMLRDRIIINGRRYAGAFSKRPGTNEKTHSQSEADELKALRDVLAIAEEVVNAVLISSGFADSFGIGAVRSICMRALKYASRTYSAFVCHTALHHIVDLSDSEVCVVPESLLAMPLVMKFTASAPPVPFAAPVLKCELQAATVYRLCFGEDLHTLFQCKTVYCKTFREIPKKEKNDSSHSSSVSSDSNSDLEAEAEAVPAPPIPENKFIKECDSEAYLILTKETTTTSRDWGHPR